MNPAAKQQELCLVYMIEHILKILLIPPKLHES